MVPGTIGNKHQGQRKRVSLGLGIAIVSHKRSTALGNMPRKAAFFIVVSKVDWLQWTSTRLLAQPYWVNDTQAAKSLHDVLLHYSMHW